MNRIKVQDADFVFLSYDEPNADRNYADLKKKFPWEIKDNKLRSYYYSILNNHL